MSSQGASVIVAYPRTSSSTFNKDYYLSTHMPLVKKHWTKHGLRSYAVTDLSASDDAPYTYIVVMDFESLEGFGAAAQDESIKEIMGDVDNFSNVKPVLLHGGVIGRG